MCGEDPLRLQVWYVVLYNLRIVESFKLERTLGIMTLPWRLVLVWNDFQEKKKSHLEGKTFWPAVSTKSTSEWVLELTKIFCITSLCQMCNSSLQLVEYFDVMKAVAFFSLKLIQNSVHYLVKITCLLLKYYLK